MNITDTLTEIYCTGNNTDRYVGEHDESLTLFKLCFAIYILVIMYVFNL